MSVKYNRCKISNTLQCVYNTVDVRYHNSLQCVYNTADVRYLYITACVNS